jgi:hypothetical protein
MISAERLGMPPKYSLFLDFWGIFLFLWEFKKKILFLEIRQPAETSQKV